MLAKLFVARWQRFLAFLERLEPQPEPNDFVDYDDVRWQAFCDAWVTIGTVATVVQGRR